MKITLSLLFSSLMALAPLAQGDTYKTLAGYKDAIQIPAGQTALVVSASSRVVLGVERSGKSPLQFRFDEPQRTNFGTPVVSTRFRQQNFFPMPSLQNPVLIAGPVKLILRTDGLLTLSIPDQQRRTTSRNVGPTVVRRFAKN